jgi:tryptophan-rich sensory protein
MPPFSPPFALWLVIGFLFYAMCFVILRHVFSMGLVSPSQVFALVLTVVLLLANAFWSVLFFRWCDLRASFIAFVPYAILVAAGPILSGLSYFRSTAFILSMLLDGAFIYGDLTLRTPNQSMKPVSSLKAF